MIDNDFKLGPKEHDRIFEEIRNDAMADVRPVDRPRAIVLGGQPGSGKSMALEDAKTEFEDFNVLVINGDEFRYRHPQVDEIQRSGEQQFAARTDPDAREWTRKLFEHGIEEKANIVFEGTMREAQPLSLTLKSLLEHGFDVTAKVVAAHHPVSLTAVLFRFEEMKHVTGFGRWVDPKAHEAAFDGMPKTIEHIENNKLAHHVQVVDRQGKTLYENHLIDGHWQKAPGAREAVEAERTRPLTGVEKTGLDNDWLSIYHRMHERFAQFEEIKLAGELAKIVYEKAHHQQPSFLSNPGYEKPMEREQAQAGRTYEGTVVSVDDKEIVQRVTTAERQFDVVHDKSKLSSGQASFTPGETARIKYVGQTGIALDPGEKQVQTLDKSFGKGL